MLIKRLREQMQQVREREKREKRKEMAKCVKKESALHGKKQIVIVRVKDRSNN